MRTKLGAAVLALALCVPAVAGAHIERPSYWPDPAPDCSVSPCAGGAVPTARSLSSALDRSRPGSTHVVCQGARPSSARVNALAVALRHAKRQNRASLRTRLAAARRTYARAVARNPSIRALKASIAKAVRDGYDIRPHDHRTLTAAQGHKLLRINERLIGLCRTGSIQSAVNAAGNQDRVVIMPGLYTEAASRAKPTNDPACKDLYSIGARGERTGLSYRYQVACPNDQNLIAVIGRAPAGAAPNPPLEDRHGIPDLGKCIRCNLQMEGSGVVADDVTIDAGRVASGNGPPIESAKDVGIRADRADGFVLRNVLVRHAKEHDIYVLESDGYLLDRFKAYWGGEYGVLTFVEDHGVMQNCDAAGSGDSGLYPGAGAPTGTTRDTKVYPEFRYSQQVRYCDSHHNLGGYSGTDGNSTWVHHNQFYDNTLGFTTDVFTAAGHPGFPQSSDLVEHNDFYDNNFNPYGKDSPIKPSVPEPVGVGLWIAGGNDNIVRYNNFYDNWRRGVMLFSVPDATICGPGVGKPVTDCSTTKSSTSFDNRFYGNVMGKAPDGTSKPNGVDFWWDSFAGNTGNCWYDNGAVTSSPLTMPDCARGTNPALSVGTGDAANEAELGACFATFTANGYDGSTCPWFTSPGKPGTSAAATARAADAKPLLQLRKSSFMDFCLSTPEGRTCRPFMRKLGMR